MRDFNAAAYSGIPMQAGIVSFTTSGTENFFAPICSSSYSGSFSFSSGSFSGVVVLFWLLLLLRVLLWGSPSYSGSFSSSGSSSRVLVLFWLLLLLWLLI
jgi:hypothetical protein